MREARACRRDDHCLRGEHAPIWDDDGETIIGYAECSCECCAGWCSCRKRGFFLTLDDPVDRHVCEYDEGRMKVFSDDRMGTSEER